MFGHPSIYFGEFDRQLRKSENETISYTPSRPSIVSRRSTQRGLSRVEPVSAACGPDYRGTIGFNQVDSFGVYLGNDVPLFGFFSTDNLGMAKECDE